MTNHHQCPNLNCGAQWGIEEIDFQECDCCGWPDVDEEEDEFDPENDYEMDDDDLY